MQPTELTARLKVLFEEWKAVPSAEWAAKSEAIRKEIDSTLSRYVEERLDESPRASAVALQGEVDEGLRRAIWESIFGLPSDEGPAPSGDRLRFAFLLQGVGPASDLYVAGFSIGYGNVFSVFLHGFASIGGKYESVGTGGAELDGSTPAAVQLRAFGTHEVRFLSWGLHIGSPEGLTSIVVCSFDGHELRVLWEQPSVPHAQVSVANNMVVVESEQVLSLKEGLWEHKRESYRQVPDGLKLIKTKRWTSR